MGRRLSTQSKTIAIIFLWVPFYFLFNFRVLDRSKQHEVAHETVRKDVLLEKQQQQHDSYANNTNANANFMERMNININITADANDVNTSNSNSRDTNNTDVLTGKGGINSGDNDGSSRVVGAERMFRFCEESQVFVAPKKEPELSTTTTTNDDELTFNPSLSLLYQCSGDPYDEFAERLHQFADDQQTTTDKNMDMDMDMDIAFPWKRREEGDCSAFVPSFPSALSSRKKKNQSLHEHHHRHRLWGKRDFPLADNVTVLAIGNSHLRQISKTMACQYAHKLTIIRFLPAVGELFVATSSNSSNNNDHDHSNNNHTNVESFVLEFSNDARWISVTNQVLLYSNEWNELVEEFFLMRAVAGNSNSNSNGLVLEDLDAIVLGKFTTYEQAKDTNFERTMNDEEQAYYNFRRQQQQQHLQGRETANSRRTSTLRRKLGKSEEKRTKKGHTKNATNESSSSLSSWRNQTAQIPIDSAEAAADGDDDDNNDDDADSHTRNNNWSTTSTTKTKIVSFATIQPPDILDIARIYSGPIISLSMFSKSDKARVLSSYRAYREQCLMVADQQQQQQEGNYSASTIRNTNTASGHSTNTRGNDVVEAVTNNTNYSINRNLYLIDGRRYIEQMGMECGTDDKKTMGTCREPPPAMIDNDTTSTRNLEITSSTKENKRYRDPSDMHRCAGARGGHADLVSWDVIEGLYSTISATTPCSNAK